MWDSDENDEDLARALEESLWANGTNDNELARALEESRRYYKEYEEPRLSQLQPSHSDCVAGPSTSKVSYSSVNEASSSIRSTSVASHARPSTSRDAEASSAERININKSTDNVQSKTDQDKGSNLDQRELYDGPEAEGFCFNEGKQWIYPTNDKYPIRPYQKSIVEKALFNNTLVSLPTGLGKTFIAAVVMYNFYKWYPKGKIIFMAPTKPLVAQQIDNCCNIMGIPRSHTAEMTGAMHARERTAIWQDKRVFFLTPQVVQNDLSAGICPANAVKCVVIDEAHRAVGDYAYTMVIKALNSFEARFRVLALSATPGSDLQAVQKVINNLMINHIELRNEQSPDLAQYTHRRNVETMVVQVGPTILRIQEKYLQIIQGYTVRLQQRKVLFGNVKTMARFSCIRQWDDFRREGSQHMDQVTVTQLNNDFAVVCSLLHGLELLQTYGLRLLLNHLKGVLDGKGTDAASKRLSANDEIKALMEEIELILNPIKLDADNDGPKKKEVIYGHPKLDRLQQVVISHFEQYERTGNSTRAIIFCEYREGVLEISEMLKNFEPLVKPVSFMGQASGKTSKGISQKQQLEIMEKFRRGTFNTLVSTSVGEEGLDIGEVDLIICFDAKNSPIRQVQRMGRTGRKRQGRIIMLITQGKEERKYRESIWKKNDVNTALLSVENLSGYMYDDCPRMLPPGVEPKCVEQTIEIVQNRLPCVQQDLRKMFLKRSSASSTGGRTSSVGGKNVSKISYLSEEELQSLKESWNVLNCCEFNRLPARDEVWAKIDDRFEIPGETSNALDLSHYLEFSRFEQRTHVVGNSSDSNMLRYLLSWADNRRDGEEGSQCAVYSREITSTQIWPKKGKKRSRAVAGMTDQNEEKPSKVRKRGRPKKADSIRHAVSEEHVHPEPLPDTLSDDFVKSKRLQFIEDEDEPPPPVLNLSPVVKESVPQPSSSRVASLEVEEEHSPTHQSANGCDENYNEQSTPSQILFGSQLSQKNLASSLLLALNRQLPLETDVCDICDNLFSCQSLNKLVYHRPVKELSWSKIRSSLQTAAMLLPAITKDDMKKISCQKAETHSQGGDFLPSIPRDDVFYSDDFDGGILCGGLGDCSPPYMSSKYDGTEISATKASLNTVTCGKITESKIGRLFNKEDEDSQMNHVPKEEHNQSFHNEDFLASKTCETSEKVKQSISIETLAYDSNYQAEREKEVEQSNKHTSNDTSFQHFMNDTFDFLGLSKIEDIFGSQDSPKKVLTPNKDAGKSCESLDSVDNSMSKSTSSMKYSSPAGGNMSDSSQVSPILGSQKRKKVRPKIRKLSLGHFEQEDNKSSISFDTKNEDKNPEIKLQAISEAPACDSAPIQSQALPKCDFNICDDSIFLSPPDAETDFLKTNKYDVSMKEALRKKGLELMSKSPRTLTQQFRDMCDSSGQGFTQLFDLLDKNKSPDRKIARADSSTSVEDENLIEVCDNTVESCRAVSPDLFDDDYSCFDGNHVDSSVASPTKSTLHTVNCNKNESASVRDNTTILKILNRAENSVAGKECSEKEMEQEGKPPTHFNRIPSPVLTQTAVVRKPSKLSLKNRMFSHQTKFQTENRSDPDSTDKILNEKPLVEARSSEISSGNINVSQFDIAFLGDEFNSSWSSTFGEANCENTSFKPKTENAEKNKADDNHRSEVLCNKLDVSSSEMQNKKFNKGQDQNGNRCTSDKKDFEEASQQCEALKKKHINRKLSLSCGVTKPSKLNFEDTKVKQHAVNFSEKAEQERLIILSSDDDSPVKAVKKKRNVNLNITSSPEEVHNVHSDRSSKTDKKETPVCHQKRKRNSVSSSSSDDGLEANGWLCARKIPIVRKQVKNLRHQLNESRENAFDLSSFCDDSILSPFKEDGDFRIQEKENLYKRNRENETRSKKRRKKTFLGSKKKCAFVEIEAEESDDCSPGSSDAESSNSDELDSSFINDSQPDASQSLVDMHAKYLQSVKSPARSTGAFKIPKNIHPVTSNIYSQILDTVDFNQEYTNDSFCVDDESTQLEDHEMSLLEIAEARLKAQRREKRKQRRKNIQNLNHDKEEDEAGSESSNEGYSKPQSVKKKPNQKRRRIIVEDSDSDDTSTERPVISTAGAQKSLGANTGGQKSSTTNSDSALSVVDPDPKDDEFAKLLEEDNDLFFEDSHLPLLCGNSSSAVSNISTSSPVRPSKFIKKTRVGVGQDLNKIENTHHNHQLPGTSTDLIFKVPLPQRNFSKNQNLAQVTKSMISTNSSDYKAIPIEVQRVPNSSKTVPQVIIVSSRQVASFPELIRVLRVNHNITISPRSISNADFIVSWRLGVIRTFVSDLKDRKKIEVFAKNLKEYFCLPFLIIERDRLKPLGGTSRSKKKDTNDIPKPNVMWTGANCTTMALLRQAGIHLLLAQDKDETAGLIAKLMNKERVKGHAIPQLPHNLSDDVENRLHFFSSLPCVNFAFALKLLARFPSISEFLESCSSVVQIASVLDLDIAAARRIHNLLCEVHVNP